MIPLRNLVVVKMQQNAEVSVSGIYIGEQAESTNGEVISIGIDVKELNIGDTVLLSKYGGTDIYSEHKIVKEDEILAILKKEH